jgi:hypothetical protein
MFSASYKSNFRVPFGCYMIWRHIGYLASHQAMLLMSESARDDMSPRVLSVALLLLHDFVFFHVREADADLRAYGPYPPLCLLTLCYFSP